MGSCNDVTVAPTYRPTAGQFSDLLAYIESIKHEALPYGICRIIPPVDGWKVFFAQFLPELHIL
jgi:jmjN domain